MIRALTRRVAPLTLTLFASTVMFAGAQVADSDEFRKRLRSVPELPVDRIELSVDPSVTLEMVSAVSSDESGNLYVLNRPTDGGDPIVVLDPTGRFLRSWGKGRFKIPHGIRVDPAGNVWTVDASASKVEKFTPEGALLLEVPIEMPESERAFCGATDVAFLEDGHVLVADGYCNGRVIELDADGKHVTEWGTRGTGEGQFVVAHSVAVGPNDMVYVADRENGRLHRFDRSGKFLGLWEYARQLFSVAVGPNGALYISVALNRETREWYLIQIDPETGAMLGQADGFGHELAVSKDGTLLPGEGEPSVVVYRPRK